ncbi:MAG: LuxR C-terminal-related transcriptional regulator [Candidatus Korobacteraceae bacterium]
MSRNTVKQLAGHLDLSEKTVAFHKHHVMETFNRKSNSGLVLFALKQGLISMDSILPSKPCPPDFAHCGGLRD